MRTEVKLKAKIKEEHIAREDILVTVCMCWLRKKRIGASWETFKWLFHSIVKYGDSMEG